MIRPWIRPRLAQSSTSAVSSYESRDESRSVSPVEVLEFVRHDQETREGRGAQICSPTAHRFVLWRVGGVGAHSPFFSSSGPRRATRDARDPHDREILILMPRDREVTACTRGNFENLGWGDSMYV